MNPLQAPLAFRLRCAALSAATFAFAPLSAQGPVWPAAYANQIGEGVMNAPFSVMPGNASPTTRCMVVIAAASVPLSTGTPITQIAFRRDASHAAYAGTAYTGVTGHLDLRIGNVLQGPDRLTDVRFARLWSAEPTTAYNNSYTVPNVPAAAPGPQPPAFAVVIPFSSPWTWQGGDIGIELVFTSTSGPSTFRVDAFAPPAQVNGSFRLLGPGCTGSNGFAAIHYPLPETAVPGRTLTLQMEGALLPAGGFGLAFHLLGFSSTQSGPFALPLDMVQFGMAPGCFLRTGVLNIQAAPLTNPSLLYARARAQLPIPALQAFAGVDLASQWLLLDPGMPSALQMTLSDGQMITLGSAAPSPHPAAGITLWKYGAPGYDDECGRIAPQEYGPVIRFN